MPGNQKLIDLVRKNPNTYTPPVLYSLSDALFKLNRRSEAAYWFYIAQLRARYDFNRCADKTANAAVYNQTYGPQINQYAFKNLDSLSIIVNKVVDFISKNNEAYDQRWINLESPNVAVVYYGGTQPKELSLPKKQWASIKRETVKAYLKGFNEELRRQKESK